MSLGPVVPTMAPAGITVGQAVPVVGGGPVHGGGQGLAHGWAPVRAIVYVDGARGLSRLSFHPPRTRVGSSWPTSSPGAASLKIRKPSGEGALRASVL